MVVNRAKNKSNFSFNTKKFIVLIIMSLIEKKMYNKLLQFKSKKKKTV